MFVKKIASVIKSIIFHYVQKFWKYYVQNALITMVLTFYTKEGNF